MSAASDYTETNILNASLRGVPYPLPTATYVSLQTSTTNEATGATEVSTADWPSYTRKHAENGGAIGTGWSAPATNGATKECKNVFALPFPTKNGATDVTVVGWAVWDAPTGGNLILAKDLVLPVVVAFGELVVFDGNSLTVTTA